ncbi:MAG: hypothetical protein H7Z21_06275, partial [Hymenobacter sp.]|nr:hypothetical protein [Hymenobacter sp.]
YRLRQHPPTRGQWLGLALAAGVLPLLYGNFVLLLPVLLYALWQQGGRRAWSLLLLGAGMTGLFLLPTGIWVGALHVRGVTYYNHEMVRFRQLVWLFDAAQGTRSEFLAEVGRRALAFVRTLGGVAVLLVAAPLLGAVARWRGRPGPYPALAHDALWLLGLFAAFLLALGYYSDRLTFTLQPLLLCLCATALARARLPWQRPVLLTLAVAWHLYQVLSYGPFS